MAAAGMEDQGQSFVPIPEENIKRMNTLKKIEPRHHLESQEQAARGQEASQVPDKDKEIRLLKNPILKTRTKILCQIRSCPNKLQR